MPSEPLQKQPVFVLGHPRSGTTLVQRLLNSYGDVVIWGEHGAFLKNIAQAFYRGQDHPHLWNRPEAGPLGIMPDDKNWSVQGWMNWFNKAQWLEIYRKFMGLCFLSDDLPGKNFWGFREVNYITHPTEKTLEFLAQAFPDALFIFVARDFFNVLASIKIHEKASDWRKVKSYAERWKFQNQELWKWHNSGKIKSYWLRYADFIEGRGELLNLLAAMGKNFGDTQRQILDSKFGRGTSFYNKATDTEYNERWQSLPFLWRALGLAAAGKLNQELGFANPPADNAFLFLGRLMLGLQEHFHKTDTVFRQLFAKAGKP